MSNELGRPRGAYANTEDNPDRGVGWALDALLHNERIRRRGWKNYNRYIKMTHDLAKNETYIGRYVKDKLKGPWRCAQADFLAVDWENFQDKPETVSD